jgi:hypothetical protein
MFYLRANSEVVQELIGEYEACESPDYVNWVCAEMCLLLYCLGLQLNLVRASFAGHEGGHDGPKRKPDGSLGRGHVKLRLILLFHNARQGRCGHCVGSCVRRMSDYRNMNVLPKFFSLYFAPTFWDRGLGFVLLCVRGKQGRG